jgi:hypothetical protein
MQYYLKLITKIRESENIILLEQMMRIALKDEGKEHLDMPNHISRPMDQHTHIPTSNYN